MSIGQICFTVISVVFLATITLSSGVLDDVEFPDQNSHEHSSF